MGIFILSAFYFILPAYIANMSPVIFAKAGWLEFWGRPIDGGRLYRGRPLFGTNKTWRGFVSGIIGALVVAGLQAAAYQIDFFRQLSFFDYPAVWIRLGILAGIGAIGGDLVKSFLKRRVGIKAGGAWPVFDQLDFIVGAFFLMAAIAWPGWIIFLIVCLGTLVLHPLTNIVGYLIGWKKVWW